MGIVVVNCHCLLVGYVIKNIKTNKILAFPIMRLLPSACPFHALIASLLLLGLISITTFFTPHFQPRQYFHPSNYFRLSSFPSPLFRLLIFSLVSISVLVTTHFRPYCCSTSLTSLLSLIPIFFLVSISI